MSARLISAFPATGKTHFASNKLSVVDSDSSSFSWKWITFDVRERHPDWPDNYVEHIRAKLALFDLRFVLVSTHAEIRQALVDNGIPFTLVYPTPDQREDYRQRMTRRGSPELLIRKVIDELWDDALTECAAQQGCDHIVLGPGQYLADVATAFANPATPEAAA